MTGRWFFCLPVHQAGILACDESEQDNVAVGLLAEPSALGRDEDREGVVHEPGQEGVPDVRHRNRGTAERVRHARIPADSALVGNINGTPSTARRSS